MRVFCHMVVGPGEASRYLTEVLERVGYWADFLHVTLDPRAGEEELAIVGGYADVWERIRSTWEDHEARFRAEAWSMFELTDVSPGDWVVCLDADEVIIDHNMVRPAAFEYPGHAVVFRFHEMWSPTHYRTDGHWRPYEAGIMFPYQERGHFADKALACGREPTYATLLPRSRVVGDIAHYGYAREADRVAKFERYMRLDGGRYHSRSHLESILADRPDLEEWRKGGLIGREEAVR